LVFGALPDVMVLGRAAPRNCPLLFVDDDPVAVADAQAKLAAARLPKAKVRPSVWNCLLTCVCRLLSIL
jgi:hypothetical protein